VSKRSLQKDQESQKARKINRPNDSNLTRSTIGKCRQQRIQQRSDHGPLNKAEINVVYVILSYLPIKGRYLAFDKKNYDLM